MNLRTKVVLLTSGLGAALVGLAFVLVSLFFADQVRSNARADVAAAGRTLQHAVGRSLDSHRIQAKVVSDETVLKEALVKGSADLAFTYVDSVRDRTGSEYLIVTDAHGDVLADVKSSHPAGKSLDLGASGAATSGARTGFVLIDGTLVAAAITPIMLGDRPLGALLLGDAFTPARLRDVQTISGAEMTLIAGGLAQPISTLADAELAEVTRAAGACEAARMDRVEEMLIGGTPHLMALEPLNDIGGNQLGCIVLTRSLAAPLAELRDVQKNLVLFGLLSTALAIVAGWILGSRVVKPVQTLTGAALRIAAGDLSQEAIEQAGDDEIGQMSRAFNQMLRSLQSVTEVAERMSQKDLTLRIGTGGRVAEAFNRMLDGQREVVRKIASASAQLAAAGAQIYSAAERQEAAAAVQSAGVQEVRQTMQVLSRSAAHIAVAARGVLDDAEKARVTTEGLSSRIAELNGHTKRIAQTLELIREIADRSDVLALNAALEATRTEGRSFGLVAAEMRRFAERVTGSVADVKTLLSDVQSSASAAVTAAQEARAIVEGTTESARQITGVTDGQRTATEQVLEGTQQISSMLTEAVASARDGKASAGAFKREAEDLAALVGEFRLD